MQAMHRPQANLDAFLYSTLFAEKGRERQKREADSITGRLQPFSLFFKKNVRRWANKLALEKKLIDRSDLAPASSASSRAGDRTRLYRWRFLVSHIIKLGSKRAHHAMH